MIKIEEISIFGKVCAFTRNRISKNSIPNGLYTYECREFKDNRIWQIHPCIKINFFGTIITNEEIPVLDWDYQWLNVRNGERYEYESETENGCITGVYDFEWGNRFADVASILSLSDSPSLQEIIEAGEDTHWNIPDECILNYQSTLIIDNYFEDSTPKLIEDAIKPLTSTWRKKIIVNPGYINHDELHMIRTIIKNKMYTSKPSKYKIGRIIFAFDNESDEDRYAIGERYKQIRG